MMAKVITKDKNYEVKLSPLVLWRKRSVVDIREAKFITRDKKQRSNIKIQNLAKNPLFRPALLAGEISIGIPVNCLVGWS